MEEKKTTWKVTSDKVGERLDIALSHIFPEISRSQCKRLIREGMVSVNGRLPNPSYILRDNDIVEIIIPPPEPLEIEPEDIYIDIIYEDDSLLVINKLSGLVVHPAPGHSKHTLVNALLHHCPNLEGIGGKQRPGIVHRLDKDTSGLLMVAKTQQAHNALSLQLKEKKVNRIYIALVYGMFKEKEGMIETRIGRHPKERKRMSANPHTGKEAITYWRVKELFQQFTLLELKLKTGRTHQIRVHMSYAKHPLVGDRIYGRGRIPPNSSSELKNAIGLLTGQALHAQTLGFFHPLTHEYLEFSSPLPKNIEHILDILRKEV